MRVLQSLLGLFGQLRTPFRVQVWDYGSVGLVRLVRSRR